MSFKVLLSVNVQRPTGPKIGNVRWRWSRAATISRIPVLRSSSKSSSTRNWFWPSACSASAGTCWTWSYWVRRASCAR